MTLTYTGTTVRFSAMAADPLTTIPIRTSTRDELETLKTGGQSYDDLIRALLEELEARDPWYEEMERRIGEVRSGRIKTEPIETLLKRDKRSRRSGSR